MVNVGKYTIHGSYGFGNFPKRNPFCCRSSKSFTVSNHSDASLHALIPGRFEIAGLNEFCRPSPTNSNLCAGVLVKVDPFPSKVFMV